MKHGPGKTLSIRPFMAVLAIAVIISAVYSNSFTGSWHYDDFHHIKQNNSIRKLSNLPLFFHDPSTFSRNTQARMYRPLLMTTYAINYQMGLWSSRNGDNVVWYHATNFLFHVISTFTIFIIVWFFFRRKIPVDGLDPSFPALFGALLFGLHTINTETVVYISSRSSGMAAMFVLLAFYLYIKAVDGEKIGIIPIIGSTFLYACGMMSKEIAITLPALLLYYELLLNHDLARMSSLAARVKLLLLRQAPFLVTAGAFMLIRQLVLRDNLIGIVTSRGGTAAAPNLSSQFATQSRVWIYYIREWLWPTSLSIDKSFTVSRHFSDPRVIISVVILVVILAAVLAIRKKHPLVTFGALWFFTALLPTSIFRLNVVMNDHRLYLPGLGATLIFTYIAARLFARFRSDNRAAFKVFVTVCVATLVFMGIATFKRNTVFATEETLWQDVLKDNPDSLRANQALGYFYWQDWRLWESYKFFKKALALDPAKPETHINMAAVLKDLGKTQAALEELKTAKRLAPDDPDVHFNLARFYRLSGNNAAALAEYRRALQLNPRHSLAALELRKLSRSVTP